MKKFSKIAKLHILPCLVAAVLLLSPLATAHAAVWEGSVTMTGYYWGLNADVRYRKDNVISVPYVGSSDYEGFPIVYGSQVVNGMGFNSGSDVTFTSDVDVYISGFPWAAKVAGDTISEIGDPHNISNYEVTYFNMSTSTTGEVVGGLKEIESFNPSVSSDSNVSVMDGSGIQMRVQYAGSDAYPISGLEIKPVVKSGYSFAGGSANYYTYWRYTSVRVISADTSAELDELSNVADQIIAGNQILEAMKGDVVALLQQIYTQTGDLEMAATKTNELLTALLGYVDGLESQLDDIYAWLQFSLSSLMSGQNRLYDLLQGTQTDIIGYLSEIRELIIADGDDLSGASDDKVEQGDVVQDGLGELQRPDYEDIDIDVGGYVDEFDDGSGESDAAFTGFMNTIFSSSMITTMMMVTLTFAMVAYVLYGKR